MLGRSNVGKSSLLNMLLGRHGLARVSSKPGHTRTINFFALNGDELRLVDLPGYGFARVARAQQGLFNEWVGDYLRERESLAGVLLLIDARLPPQDLDLECARWLAELGRGFVPVFTKADKVKPGALRARSEAFREKLEAWGDGLPPFLASSVKTGEGKREILGMLGAVVGGGMTGEAED